MNRLHARLSAAVTALSGLVALLAAIPSGWYGATPGDSYVFDPPAFSPLWIERTIVPALVVVAGLTLAVGFVALTYRDWSVAGRLRRWSGVVASVGFFVLGLAAITFTVFAGAGNAGVGDLLSVGLALGGLVLGLVGLLLAYPGAIALGVGFARTDRPVVGYVLVAAPVLSIVLGYVLDDLLGGISSVLPVSVALWVVAWELWTHPDPLPEPDGRNSRESSG